MLRRPRWARFNKVINRFALPLFLFHTTGMAVYLVIGWGLLGARFPTDPQPDLSWWLQRPVAVLGPLLCKLPVIWLFGRWSPPVAKSTEPDHALEQRGTGQAAAQRRARWPR